MADTPPLYNHNSNPDENHSPFAKVSQTNTYKKDDPPLIDLKITNPVTYLKKWWKIILSREGINISFRIRPLTAILMTISIVSIFTGIGLTVTKFYFLPLIVPSNLVSTESFYSGTVYKTQNQIYLMTSSEKVYPLKKPPPNIAQFFNQKVVIKGKLDKNTNTLEVKQIEILQ